MLMTGTDIAEAAMVGGLLAAAAYIDDWYLWLLCMGAFVVVFVTIL